MSNCAPLKRCFREPIPEIFDAARYLDAAVSAHLRGHASLAAELFSLANDPKVWAWTNSIWGKKSPYVIVRKQPDIKPIDKALSRMPTSAQKAELHKRDGFHCRFCGIPVVRSEIRKIIQKIYPSAVQWGSTNASQHAAFQCMWAQYDHVVPHSHGGTNELTNLVTTCAACNFGKMEYTLDELGLIDPRTVSPIQSMWDGLERVTASN
ncbi:MAG: HNH endonuclease [Betaproteobacteria bacterium]|nr:HNH endonuclease [Betaproteobacteria bacterium]